MASKLITLSIAVMLLMDSGCSKYKGLLSRNDYSEMQDPFMEPSGDVAKDIKGTSGHATLDDADSAIADRRDQSTLPGSSGPKPIRTTGAMGETNANGRRVSAAVYPSEQHDQPNGGEAGAIKSYSGPALSDFLQKRKAAATNAAEVPPLSTQSSSPRNTLNPAATHAALPTMNPEVESFSSFLSEKSNVVAEKSQQANQTVQNASSGVNDFASWAEQQKSEWSNSAQSAKATVSGAPAAAKATAQAMSQQMKSASVEMANSLSAPDFDGGEEETATPLLKQKFTPPETTATLPRAKAPSSADSNPFADSFEEFHSNGSNVTASREPAGSTATPARRSSSLDDTFRMDTGWKPSNMTRP